MTSTSTYYDTKDEAVLKALKEWFDGMNVVQRTVMAQNIRLKMQRSFGDDMLAPLFRNIYLAIQEYDIADMSDIERRSLENMLSAPTVE